MLLDPKPGETEVEFWQRQNKYDNAIGLYCQSCCYRYPDECIDIGTLHPYDRAAETCPDFVPKDYYKALSWAKCWKKRLAIDPDYIPLPGGKIWHPYYLDVVISSAQYYKIITKAKALKFLEVK